MTAVSAPTRSDPDAASAAVIEYLTGPSRGSVSWLEHTNIDMALGPDGQIRALEAKKEKPEKNVIARIKWTGDAHVIDECDGGVLWVNGKSVSTRPLRHQDVIEFGENGPISRYLVYDRQHPIPGTIADILSDAGAYFRNSRQPVSRRIARMLGLALRRLARETTIMFRVGVIIVLIVLAAVVYQQNRINALLQEQIESGIAELNSFARTLARLQDEALSSDDLDLLRQELGGRMATTVERVTELELRSGASARVISQSVSSVVLLQGAYGYSETATGRMLRHATTNDGEPIFLPDGSPLLSLDGQGEVAQRQFMGTGFLIGDGRALITSRHVGLPWSTDSNTKLLAAKGLEAVMIRFVAYVPGIENALDVKLIDGETETDVAILQLKNAMGEPTGLSLSEELPKPGDEVIVLGYPTGLRSILAQAGNAFIDDLQKSGDVDFWSVAARLSTAGLIIPLASRGIVGRVSEDVIAYDAETTYGGSGGPVLDENGKVVAVNSAILPEYGGSNLGVPVEKVRQLLIRAELH